jgi:hypothetical protein
MKSKVLFFILAFIIAIFFIPCASAYSYTADLTGGMSFSASSSQGVHPVSQAFDDFSGSYWGADGAPTQWVECNFGVDNNKTIKKLTLKSHIWTGGVPNSFELRASNDGTNWNTIYAGNMASTASTTNTYTFANNVEYRYYRVYVLSLHAGTYALIDEIQMMEGYNNVWVENSSIVTGLGNIGGYSSPEVFYMDDTWKLISGENDGTFNGFDWNTSTSQWDSNSTLVTGLVDTGNCGDNTVFNDSGIWKLIAGNYYPGGFYGYQWNTSTSQWDSNSSIVAGLVDIGYESDPTVFDDSGTWKLIAGERFGTFDGYQWNTSTSQWDSNSSIVAGLGDIGTDSSPIVFNDSGTLKFIGGQGESTDTFHGFYWDSDSWVSNSSIVAGLDNVGAGPAPTVYYDSGLWKLIAGNNGGTFLGFQRDILPLASNLMTEHVTDNDNVTTNTSAPYFNWTYSDTENDEQSHWEIWVGTSHGTSDMWNSGQLAGNDTNDVYGGSTLSGDVTYYVQVRTKDGIGWGFWAPGTFELTIPTNPTNFANTTGNFWVNHTWDIGANTDFFNVSVNGSWTNGSTNTYYNDSSLSPHEWSNITVYAHNTTSGVLSSGVSQNVQVPNNEPVISNARITPSAIRENDPFTVFVDINDSDGNPSSVLVKINYHNYTMVQGTGDTWSYIFTGTQVPTRYYVMDFYAEGDFGAWNTTNSSLYIDAVSSTGTGSTGGVSPTPTPTETPEPTQEPPIEKIPINITEKVENIVDMFHMYTDGNYISIFHINFDKEEKIYSKQIYVDSPTHCSILNESTLISECALGNGVVTISMPFVPENEGLFLSTRDYVEIGGDNEVYHVNVDIFIINLYTLITLENGMLILIILLAIIYFKKKGKKH